MPLGFALGLRVPGRGGDRLGSQAAQPRLHHPVHAAPGGVQRGRVIGQKPLRDTEFSDRRLQHGHHVGDGLPGRRTRGQDTPGVIVDYLQHAHNRAVSQLMVEPVELPTLVRRGIREPPCRLGSLLRAWFGYAPAGKDPRQRRPRRSGQPDLEHRVAHTDRAAIPAVLEQVGSHLQRELLDIVANPPRRRQRTTRPRPHHRQRAIPSCASPQLIEPRPANPIRPAKICDSTMTGID